MDNTIMLIVLIVLIMALIAVLTSAKQQQEEGFVGDFYPGDEKRNSRIWGNGCWEHKYGRDYRYNNNKQHTLHNRKRMNGKVFIDACKQACYDGYEDSRKGESGLKKKLGFDCKAVVLDTAMENCGHRNQERCFKKCWLKAGTSRGSLKEDKDDSNRLTMLKVGNIHNNPNANPSYCKRNVSTSHMVYRS